MSLSHEQSSYLQDAAQIAVVAAVRAGTLTPMPCQVCSHQEAEAHHQDYTRPLSVVWLCKKHHGGEHKRLRKLGRDRMAQDIKQRTISPEFAKQGP
jgi:hypothetical protein